jgi:ABC-type uncharacterized transport system substrate-binding protein
LSTLGSGLVAKRIELIRELVPKAQRLGLLYDSREPAHRINREAAFGTAKLLGLTVVEENVNLRDQLPAAFAALKKKGTHMLLVLEGSLGFINRDLTALTCSSESTAGPLRLPRASSRRRPDVLLGEHR